MREHRSSSEQHRHTHSIHDDPTTVASGDRSHLHHPTTDVNSSALDDVQYMSSSHSSSSHTMEYKNNLSILHVPSKPFFPEIHVFKAFDVVKESKKKDWRQPLRRRSSQFISMNEMLSVLHLTQLQACKVLGCSVSTVKRRFSELKQHIGLSQWPKDYFELENSELFKKIYPLSLYFILNHDEEEETMDASESSNDKNEQQRKKKKLNLSSTMTDLNR